MFRNAAWIGVRVYQVVVSPADGASCTFYPSCTSYSLRAVRRNGPLVGAWMAVARLQRRHKGERYPMCRANGQLFQYNPPEHDEWWREEAR